MNRRKFIQSFAGAIASVAIGMKLSQGMPELAPRIEEVKYKATERFSEPYVDWRGLYGTPSGLEGNFVRVDNP